MAMVNSVWETLIALWNWSQNLTVFIKDRLFYCCKKDKRQTTESVCNGLSTNYLLLEK